MLPDLSVGLDTAYIMAAELCADTILVMILMVSSHYVRARAAYVVHAR